MKLLIIEPFIQNLHSTACRYFLTGTNAKKPALPKTANASLGISVGQCCLAVRAYQLAIRLSFSFDSQRQILLGLLCYSTSHKMVHAHLCLCPGLDLSRAQGNANQDHLCFVKLFSFSLFHLFFIRPDQTYH